MLRNLTTDFIINEKIVTTEARAKEVRSTVEKMITLGNVVIYTARRQAASFIYNETADITEKEDNVFISKSALQKLLAILHHVTKIGKVVTHVS